MCTQGDRAMQPEQVPGQAPGSGYGKAAAIERGRHTVNAPWRQPADLIEWDLVRRGGFWRGCCLR
jgi:hypothetical protein